MCKSRLSRSYCTCPPLLPLPNWRPSTKPASQSVRMIRSSNLVPLIYHIAFCASSREKYLESKIRMTVFGNNNSQDQTKESWSIEYLVSHREHLTYTMITQNHNLDLIKLIWFVTIYQNFGEGVAGGEYTPVKIMFVGLPEKRNTRNNATLWLKRNLILRSVLHCNVTKSCDGQLDCKRDLLLVSLQHSPSSTKLKLSE